MGPRASSALRVSVSTLVLPRTEAAVISAIGWPNCAITVRIATEAGRDRRTVDPSGEAISREAQGTAVVVERVDREQVI